ncbi:MAG: hypothetical protein HZA58_00030 [Acidimicrobiia bacterium]|nr:hypothetical protein [Acidimicrobiia bacterium]
MRALKANTRPLVRLLSTLVAVAMMWLPATAHAEDPGTTTTVLPLLGSGLTIEIMTDVDGAVTAVVVDGTAVDFEQEDDEISFQYTTADGQTFTIEVEFGDDDDDESDDHDDEGDLDDDSDDDSDEDSDEDEDDSDEDEDEDEDDDSDDLDDDLDDEDDDEDDEDDK